MYVGIYAIITVLQTLASPLKTLLTLRAHTRIQSNLVWIEFAMFAAIAIILTPLQGLMGLAWARLIASGLNLLLMLATTHNCCQLSISRMVPSLLRPLIGAVLMAWLVMSLPDWSTSVHLLFATDVLCGGIFYVSWSIITWHFIGKPEGLESTVWDRLFEKKKQTIGNHSS